MRETVPQIRTSARASDGPVTPLQYTTGFEADQGFTVRGGDCVQTCELAPTGVCGFIGDGTQGSGAYPEPWGVMSDAPVDRIEGHISTQNPYSGTQHLRISEDVCTPRLFDGTLLRVDARVPADPPLPGVMAPATISAQVAIPTGLFGSNLSLQTRAPSQGLITAWLVFSYDGPLMYALDNPGLGRTFIQLPGYWDSSGAYQNVTVHTNPCDSFRCIDPGPNVGGLCPNGDVDCRQCGGGERGGTACRTGLDCPGGTCFGGTCVGRIDYYYGGELVYQGATVGGTKLEQLLFFSDNWPGHHDVDDLSIQTGAPCLTECGNHEIEAGEECDALSDHRCPGRCVPPGGTGPDGEPECTCVLPHDSCAQAQVLPHGTTNTVYRGG